MGVHKLWDLLTATALPVRVESLFGKVCCIDASFWIIHCVASDSINRLGGDINAVFFLRICYLLDKGIKPVFVFDGKSPFAKVKTIIKRRMLINKYAVNHKLLAYKLMAKNIKNTNEFMESVAAVANPILAITNAVEPEQAPDVPIQVEDQEPSGDVNLFDLFPDEFLNKTEEELDEDLKVFKNIDFLSSKSKYELINTIKDNIIQKDRDKSLKLKGLIDEYSKHQIQSYMRDMKINNEIEQLKNELYQRHPIQQSRAETLNFRNSLSDEIYNYNDYFSTNYENNFIALTDQYKNEPDPDEYVKYEIEEKPQQIIDDSVFATDDQIFGSELLEGIENVDSHDHSNSDSDLKKQNDMNLSSSTDSGTNNLLHRAGNDTSSNNDFFLNLYKQYCLQNQGDEQSNKLVDYLENTDSEESEMEESDNDQRSEDGDEVFVSQKPDNIIQPEQTDTIKYGQHRLYYDETQALLDLFGVPYIISPSEAESQCAHMNMVGDCYAVISDDSDSLVFGAKSLLKNFYNDNVFELYTSERILTELGIGRKQLALIAIICGCDYTNGIRGIGIVNALEVIKAYPEFEDLYEFKHWATSDTSIESATSDECPLRSAYKKAHINYRIHWTFSSDFPNREAYELFLNPQITTEYSLSWKKPKFDSLFDFMCKKSSLPHEEIKHCIDMLTVKRSQQFIMEDIMPDLKLKHVVKSSLSAYRKNLKTNISAFRNVLSDINSRSRFKISTKLVRDPNHTLTKIRSKRMVESIKTIRKRYIKNKK